MKKLPYIVSDIHPMFSSSIIKKSLLVGASLSLVQLATAQNVVEADSIVVENGMFFGDGDDDPALSKDPASKDFHLDLAADGVFSMFRGTDPLPVNGTESQKCQVERQVSERVRYLISEILRVVLITISHLGRVCLITGNH